jgi:hypothetical protein
MKFIYSTLCLIVYCLQGTTSEIIAQTNYGTSLKLDYPEGSEIALEKDMDNLERNMLYISDAGRVEIKVYVREAGKNSSPDDLANMRLDLILFRLNVEIKTGCQIESQIVQCSGECPGLELVYYERLSDYYLNNGQADTILHHSSGVWLNVSKSFMHLVEATSIQRIESVKNDFDSEQLKSGLLVQHFILEISGNLINNLNEFKLILPLNDELKSQRLEVGKLNSVTGNWERVSNIKYRTFRGVKCLEFPVKYYGIYALQSRVKTGIRAIEVNASKQLAFLSAYFQAKNPVEANIKGTISANQRTVVFSYSDAFESVLWNLTLQDVDGNMYTAKTDVIQKELQRLIRRKSGSTKLKLKIKPNQLKLLTL